MICFLGAVFDVNINENKQVIEYAIARANKIVLDGEEFQLTSEIVEVAYGNEYATSKAVCELLEVRVGAIFLCLKIRKFSHSICRKVFRRFSDPTKRHHQFMPPIFATPRKCHTLTHAGIPSQKCRL